MNKKVRIFILSEQTSEYISKMERIAHDDICCYDLKKKAIDLSFIDITVR